MNRGTAVKLPWAFCSGDFSLGYLWSEPFPNRRQTLTNLSSVFNSPTLLDTFRRDWPYYTYLDAMVTAVSYDNCIVGADRDPSRPRKTTRLAPPTPHFEQLPPFLQVLVPNCWTSRCETGWQKKKVHHLLIMSCYLITCCCKSRGRGGACRVFLVVVGRLKTGWVVP